jgi:hypothetical protein
MDESDKTAGMSDVTLDAFVLLESAVWDALCGGDAEADAALLTEDFLGVYPTGFASRADHAGQLASGPTMGSYAIEDARIRIISSEQVLLSYRADYRRAGLDHAETMYISSLWSLIDGRWLNNFSQDTPAVARP